MTSSPSKKRNFLVTAVLSFALFESRAAFAQYTITPLSDPSASGPTVPDGINDAGTIVGGYTTGPGTSNLFIRTAGTYADYSGPTTDSFLGGISNAGSLVGTTYTSTQSGLSYHGYLQVGAVTTAISAPASPNQTLAESISNKGVVAGYYFVNDAAIGYTYASGVFSTFTVPNSYDTFVAGINSSGDVVGYFVPTSNQYAQEGFVYNGSTFTIINDPNGIDNTAVLGINDLGQLVGAYTDSTGDVHGYVDTNGTFTTVDGLGNIDRTQINGINNAGTIIGYYEGTSDVQTGFVATTVAVPEPSQSMLVCAALCGGLISLNRPIRNRA